MPGELCPAMAVKLGPYLEQLLQRHGVLGRWGTEGSCNVPAA